MADPVTLDPTVLRNAVCAVVFIASAIELGCAFIMRGGREAAGDDL